MSETIDRYLTTAVKAIQDTPRGALDAILTVLRQAHADGRMIFACGNGGSAATAEHFACDLTKIGVKCYALSANTSTLTMLANDSEYGLVFVEQLKVLARPGDVVLLISVSGESHNVRNALNYAHRNGLTTIALVGQNNGTAGRLAHHTVRVPCEAYGPVEDAHLVLCHALANALAREVT